MDALTGAVVWTVETLGALQVWGAVEVELVTVAEGSPMAAAVGWDQDAGCWRVLAADQVKGRRLLFLLLHELGHVVSGDVVKSDWSTLALDRAIMTGAARASGLTAVRQSVLSRAVSTSEGSRAEKGADAWAEEQTSRLWPMVEKLGRLVEFTEQGG